MNRHYRGKRLDNNEWVIGDYYTYCGMRRTGLINTHYIITDEKVCKSMSITKKAAYAVNPDTVGQSLGIKDKNGANEIFEDDILLCKSKGKNWWVRVVEYRAPHYILNGTYFKINVPELRSKVIGWVPENNRVIGNIHDNDLKMLDIELCHAMKEIEKEEDIWEHIAKAVNKAVKKDE